MLFALVDSIKALNEKFDGGNIVTNKWQKILPDDSNGSRIIITTKATDVAAYADSSSPLHEMHFMDVDQSWILLRQKVFNEQHCPPEFGEHWEDDCKKLQRSPARNSCIAGIYNNQSDSSFLEDIAKKVI
ncbi:UNVERIFIED_CONTAM: hypothetical protein Sangu_3237100 [Sesamum angustifolium]|uniref:NB-ARC domain-containing protein n=1 Tax=Sesamum angustifolium TaxID=2727405 RepID=A0AAW2JFQ8_9LAMI